MTSASHHQAKRPYAGSQPSITSYFSADLSTSIHGNDPSASSASEYEVRAPPLPPSVQSSLLNVGMRVRKSVPEGYKTGTNYSAFTLFTDSNTANPNMNSPSSGISTPMSPFTTSESAPTSTMQASLEEKPVQKTRPRAGARELTPFCGLLKIGGMAQQQWGIYSPKGRFPSEIDMASSEDDEDNEIEEVPWLSSQGSTISSSSVGMMDAPTPRSGSGNRKRYFVEDDEEESNFGHGNGTFGGFGFGNESTSLTEGRVLAVPRRKKWAGNGTRNVRVFGEQDAMNMAVNQDDFEDAEFLDYGLVAGEVEMSG